VNDLLIVIKIGGDLLKDGLPEDLIQDIVLLNGIHKVILVHGGGDIVTDISEKLGHPPKFIVSPKGFKSRYTDRNESSIYTMVMAGKINKEIVIELEEKGVTSLGLSGLDAHIIRAKRKKKLIIMDERGRRRLIEGGYTGQIKSINSSLMFKLLDLGVIPIVSPIAMGEEYEALNVDGDRTASAIASALSADRLILLTDVRGIILNNKLVPHLSMAQAEKAMENIGPGMITKVFSAVEAVKNGVKESIIASGTVPNPLTDALEHLECTVISN
jgi:acetylglutamate/LysW-gamma-L-alpha-aminoadipate kinase